MSYAPRSEDVFRPIERKPGGAWLWIGLLLLFLPFAALVPFAHPAGDDYCFAKGLGQRGFLANQVWFYENWGGRYSATAILSLSQLLGRIEQTYPLFVALVLVGTYASLIAFFRIFKARDAGMATGAAGAGLSFAILVYLLGKVDSPSQNFYWLPGALTYQIGFCSLLLSLKLSADLLEARAPAVLSWRTAALAVLAIVLGGQSEVFILVGLGMLGGLLLVALIDRNPCYRTLALIVAVFALACAASLLAPGNHVRAAMDAVRDKPGLVTAVAIAAQWSIKKVLLWMSDVGIWVLALAAALFLRVPAMDGSRTGAWFRRRHPAVKVALLLGGLWIGVFLTAFPVVYALGGLPYSRVINTAFMIFVVGIIASSVVLAAEIEGPDRRALRPLLAGLFGLLAVSVVGSPNFAHGWRDLRHIPALRADLAARQALVAQARPDTELVFDPLAIEYDYALAGDLKHDPTHWSNVCYAEYAGVRSVRVRASRGGP